MSANARPSNCKANRNVRRNRFAVPANCGSRRAETNSRRRFSPRFSAIRNTATKNGIAIKPQNHCGAPKLMDGASFQLANSKDRNLESCATFLVRSTASLRQFFPNRLRQQNLPEQQTAATHDANRKEIAVLLIFFHAHGRLLHFVDVAINLLERFRIRRAKKLSARNLGNFLQPRLVEFYPLFFVKDVTQRVR